MSKGIVLVTGASAGLGAACADRLARVGWTVIGASRRGTSSGAWHALSMDVDDDDSVAHGVASVLEDHGRLDALVTCAGWGIAGAAEQTPTDVAKSQLETNFWGTVRCVHDVLPAFRTQGGGRIVMMGSIGGVIGIPFQSFYSASKFALEGYAEALAYEVEPFGVQVTLVEPGNFKTDFTQSRKMVATPSNDPYATARERAISKMEHDERNGADPSAVATVVDRLLESSRAPRRVSVGKFDERAGVFAKRLLPFRLFEKSARGSLGV